MKKILFSFLSNLNSLLKIKFSRYKLILIIDINNIILSIKLELFKLYNINLLKAIDLLLLEIIKLPCEEYCTFLNVNIIRK